MKTEQTLEDLIYETIFDINKWHDVLKAIIGATGASRGIITLRDRLTAELVVPKDIRQELASPLVYGFSEEEVYSYIEHYIHHDPWTEIENLYHPDEPYALSQYIDLKTLQASSFWKWLEPQGINDTVIIKIGDSSSKYWVAMNLYYDSGHNKNQTSIINLLKKHKETINRAWNNGRRARLGQLDSSYLIHFLELENKSILLINSHKEIIKTNKSAKKIIPSISIKPTPENKHLFLQNSPLDYWINKSIEHLHKNASLDKNGIEETIITDKKFQLSLISTPESLLGNDNSIFILTITDQTIKQAIWEHPELTKRERELVEILAKGGRVVDFQKHYKITKSTAHMHWQNVKSKLNIKDRSEIHAQYEVFSKTSN